jgi:uncharacterized Fe-S radical SAM superfamily protein PflX
MSDMTILELWNEMKEEFKDKAKRLEALKEGRIEQEQFRLSGKVEGVNHALESMRQCEVRFPLLFEQSTGTDPRLTETSKESL